MRVKIQFEARLPVVFKEENNQVVACCPILDVVSQGDDREDAKRNLKEAISLFFITCYDHGTLDQVMKELGFTFSPDITQDEVLPGPDSIDVQIPFISPEHNTFGCHA